MSTATTARAAAKTIAPNARVLAMQPLRPGAALKDTSMFADPVWHLGPAMHQAHLRAVILDFTSLPDQFVLTAKELFYALLTRDVGHGYNNIKKIISIYGMFTELRDLLVWLDARDHRTLSDVTEGDIEEYWRDLVGQRLGLTAQRKRKRACRLLWQAQAKFTTDRLSFDPMTVPEPGASGETRPRRRRRRRTENSTERIPEQVHAPLLVWALRWVDDFADDVLTAYEEWTAVSFHTSANRTRREKTKNDGAGPALERVLHRYRLAQRALPGASGWHSQGKGVNFAQLARETGCGRSTITKKPAYRLLIDQAAADLGVSEATYLWARGTATLDGEPWTGEFSYDDFELITRLLQAACYIVIAFLSGMRDSEVKHLRSGCLEPWRNDTGRVVRHRVNSLAFKGEDDPTGVPATWIVTGPAARAIAVLERLQPKGGSYLFAVLPSSPMFLATSPDNTKTVTQTNKDLAAFVSWINDYCRFRGRADGIPLVNGAEWNLTTSQFRRTLAWFIARRPGGVIAGAIQYRHARVQMFEGYAGTSESGFRAEVEAEETIARGEVLGDIITEHAHHRLTGPAATQAEARLETFEKTVRFDGKVITDRKRMQRFMAKNDPHIYPGKFVTCSDNPDRRLCQLGDSARPSLGDCQPLRCRNAAFTEDNRACWREHRDELDAELAEGDVLAPLYRIAVEDKLREVNAFLTTHEPHVPAQRETVL